MRTALLLAMASLLLAGCGQKGMPKDDAQAAAYAKDEVACRAQVRDTAQSERNIEDQRRATFEGERERWGQQDIYSTMSNQGYTNNFDRLLARCMEARGWAPKSKPLLPKLSW
jgi:predicted small lipoprotein YifL